MATQGNIQVPPDSTGKRVDAASLDDAAAAVYRQKMVVTGHSGTAEVVVVMATAPAGTEMGLVVRQAGAISVNGGVAISGTATVAGSVVISGTATVAGSVVISGTATVAGVVGLTTGTANIGSINGISATVTAAITRIYAAPANSSASRGPKSTLVSTSANAILVAAPGLGMAIYVTSVMVSNASGTNSRARIGTSAGNVVQMMMAASGGGFTCHYDPPWKISSNEALVGSVKPNVSEGIFNVHFFVASADAL